MARIYGEAGYSDGLWGRIPPCYFDDGHEWEVIDDIDARYRTARPELLRQAIEEDGEDNVEEDGLIGMFLDEEFGCSWQRSETEKEHIRLWLEARQ